jgi:hypothetical protein
MWDLTPVRAHLIKQRLELGLGEELWHPAHEEAEQVLRRLYAAAGARRLQLRQLKLVPQRLLLLHLRVVFPGAFREGPTLPRPTLPRTPTTPRGPQRSPGSQDRQKECQ